MRKLFVKKREKGWQNIRVAVSVHYQSYKWRTEGYTGYNTKVYWKWFCVFCLQLDCCNKGKFGVLQLDSGSNINSCTEIVERSWENVDNGRRKHTLLVAKICSWRRKKSAESYLDFVIPIRMIVKAACLRKRIIQYNL